MEENKSSKKLGYYTPASDNKAFPTAKERMIRLCELQIRVLAQIDVINKFGNEKDKAITRDKVWSMAQKTDNGYLSAIYNEEYKKAQEKFCGIKDKDTSIVKGFEDFD